MSHFTAHFQPEAWVNNYAVPVDAEGPTTWDVTRQVYANWAYFSRLGLFRIEIDDEVTDDDDVLQRDPEAPEWVREWRGPFTITVYKTIRRDGVDYE